MLQAGLNPDGRGPGQTLTRLKPVFLTFQLAIGKPERKQWQRAKPRQAEKPGFVTPSDVENRGGHAGTVGQWDSCSLETGFLTPFSE